MKLKKILWNLLVLLIIGYVGILAYQNISQYQRFKVNGQSMNPTLKDGQKLIMKKFQKNDKLHRGDVVIIKVTLKDKEYDYFVNGKNNILKEMKNDIDSLSKSQSTKK